MSTTTIDREVSEREQSPLALKSEIGRRAKNKVRKAKGEKPAGTKNWVARGMSQAEIAQVLAGETVSVAFKNRDVIVSLKS